MNQTIEDFLNREEGRRNRSLSKRFRTWLFSEKARLHAQKLERCLAKAGNEHKASLILRQCEEAYKTDDAYRKQDNKRKKSLKQFRDAFDNWLRTDRGKPYLDQILETTTDTDKEIAREDAEKAFARANPHLLPEDYRDTSKTRIRPVRHARTKGVEDLSFDVIEPGLNQLGLVGASIVRNWEEIVGSALAKNTQAERVTFPPKARNNGTLYVKVRAGFNTIIQHHTQQIIFRINSHFGFSAVSEIRISKRFYEDFDSTGNRAARKVMAARITPAAELSPNIKKMIANISDPDLRAAFEGLGKVIKGRNG
ncbi:DciA family protein [Terasakiella sp. A23]|uniref:DUF721 domain-containing protein n=1 Tax=Terasakiella sp. FCG-A23 TaxID=3080561 RepID=UPI002954F0FF|nr:DciA family protein [Terasakiella sp. A23]MDV7340014.1 DciA family protein [Terasakiella sp. A23]